ncbi:MAG: integration host factor subunit alpha [Devosia sp.]|uniref:HU family DNA-binding protein n=1 Tax=Devosia sp. TaxID=1871048 RepID=UPI00261BB120|nr:HU family DNA-binding protein [Devosia sp.]MDB5585510.1 integration host factor subunit alpha [Devosia sp.]
MTETITKAMLCAAVARRTGLPKADVAAISDAMFAAMSTALTAGDYVKLSAFGTLAVRPRAERVGRNPRTGEQHRIAPRHTVTFIPSGQLREALCELTETKTLVSAEV